MKIMKKYFNLFVVSLFVVCMCTACGSKSTEGTEAGTETPVDSAVSYECPMHPEVKSDKPGSCDKCGMDLEQVKK